MRAEVAAAPRHHQSPDRPATAAAGFAGTLANTLAGVVIAGAASDVHVVAEASALELGGVVQDFSDCPKKTAGCGEGWAAPVFLIHFES